MSAGEQAHPWDVLLFAGEASCKPAEELADDILESRREQLLALLFPGFGGIDLGPEQAGYVALVCAQIIREQPFPGDNTLIGYSFMRMLLERPEGSWPDRRREEMARAVRALETGAMDDTQLLEWVWSWVAPGAQPRDQRGGEATA